MVVGRVHVERARVPALGEAHVVGVAGTRQAPRDLPGEHRIDAAADAVVAGQLEAEDEIAAAALAHARHEVFHQMHAAFEVAAIGVVAIVGPGRHELVEQMAVAAGQLDAAEAAAFEARGGIREVTKQGVDLVDRQHVRHGPADVVGEGRGPDRFVVAAGGVTAAAGVLQLADQSAILAFDRVGPASQPGEFIVVPGADPRRDTPLVRRGGERLGDDHAGAAARAVGVVLDQAIGDATIETTHGGHRRVDDAVAQPLSRQRERRKQPRVG